MTNLFREGNVPDLIRFHDSGKWIVGDDLWRTPGSVRDRQINLHEMTPEPRRNRE